MQPIGMARGALACRMEYYRGNTHIMDFLDPDKKRAHIIRLFIGYILVAIAIAMGSLVLLFQSLGYDVDRRTGQVIQNGLVFLSAHPEQASIYLNGKLNKTRTDARLTIPAGQYQVDLKRAGYNDWKRSFYLDGGSVERIDYPILFPSKLVTADVQLYSSAPGLVTQSPDKRWLLVQQPGSISAFDAYDLNNPRQLPTTLTLPADLLTPATGDQKLSLEEWSNDNKHVLIKHDYPAGSEFIMIDRETPANSFNANRTLNLNTVSLSLRDKRSDQLMVYDAATQALQVYDVKAKKLTPLIQKVVNFKTHGTSLILYSTQDTGPAGPTTVKLWDGSASYTMRTFVAGTDVALDITQHDSDWYMVIASKRPGGQTYIYKDPQDFVKQAKTVPLVPVSALKLDTPAFLSFSSNTRFVLVQNGSKFAVYDIEADRRYYYELKPAVAVDQQTRWMDGFHLVLVVDGKTTVVDYDGINQQTLAANNSGYLPLFNRDYTGLYNIAPSTVVPGRPALIRTELKVIK